MEIVQCGNMAVWIRPYTCEPIYGRTLAVRRTLVTCTPPYEQDTYRNHEGVCHAHGWAYIYKGHNPAMYPKITVRGTVSGHFVCVTNFTRRNIPAILCTRCIFIGVIRLIVFRMASETSEVTGKQRHFYLFLSSRLSSRFFELVFIWPDSVSSERAPGRRWLQRSPRDGFCFTVKRKDGNVTFTWKYSCLVSYAPSSATLDPCLSNTSTFCYSNKVFCHHLTKWLVHNSFTSLLLSHIVTQPWTSQRAFLPSFKEVSVRLLKRICKLCWPVIAKTSRSARRCSGF